MKEQFIEIFSSCFSYVVYVFWNGCEFFGNLYGGIVGVRCYSIIKGVCGGGEDERLNFGEGSFFQQIEGVCGIGIYEVLLSMGFNMRFV